MSLVSPRRSSWLRRLAAPPMGRLRPRLAVLSLGVIVCLCGQVAIASAEPDPAKANALFKRAKTQLDGGEPHTALALVTRAANYFAHPAIFMLKAKTLLVLGRYAKAKLVLDAISTRKLPSRFKKARSSALKVVKSELAKRGHLVLTVSPKQAVVRIAGVSYPGGVDTWLLAGSHDARISAPGFAKQRKKIRIEIGDRAEDSVTLGRLMGTIRVAVSGGLRAVVLKLNDATWDVADGARTGDVVSRSVPVGAHRVTCSRGSLSESHEVQVALNKTVAVSCSQIGGGLSPVIVRSAGWGGVAGGVALLGYGLWGLSSYYADVAKTEREGLVLETNKDFGSALYIASGLAVSVGSYFLFVREPAKASTKAVAEAVAEERVNPAISPDLRPYSGIVPTAREIAMAARQGRTWAIPRRSAAAPR